MLRYETIPDYLEAVSAQIRWKRTRPGILSELKQHLEDQRDAFAREGHANAEQLAVDEMGDPVAVGAELDRIHCPRPQYGLLALTMFLASSGAALRVWLSAAWAQYDMNADLKSTLLAVGLGCTALLCGYFLDYTRLGLQGKKLYLGAFLAGILALALSPHANGIPYYARYITLCYPVGYVFWLYTCYRRGWTGLIRAMAGGIPLAWICLMIPDMFSLLTLLLTGLALWAGAAWYDWFGVGRRKTLLVILCGAGALAAAAVWFSSPGELQRLKIALNPELEPLGRGYQGTVIREALGTSQWVGEGAGTPLPYEMTVPGGSADALLTTLIYKVGWLAFLSVILAFALLVVWLLHRCFRQKNRLGKAVVLAVVVPLCLQALSGIAWNLGYTLFSPSFPLITSNWNTVVTMGLIGLALSVFREERMVYRQEGSQTRLLPRCRIKILIQKC